MEEGEPIEHGLISKAIENAQRKVEGQNFEIRKHLLEYDDVMNKQREVIYKQRKDVLRGENLRHTVNEMLDEVVDEVMAEYIDADLHPEEWNLKGLEDMVFKQFGIKEDFAERERVNGLNAESIREIVLSKGTSMLDEKEKNFGKELMDQVMKIIMLQSIDSHWKDHLLAMDHLKEGIGLRGYGQKDPLREYQREGYEMFMDMVYRIKEDIIEKLSWVQVQVKEDLDEVQKTREEEYVMSRGDAGGAVKQVRREGKKVGRNDPCPCGSGRKYKKCCGR
jgi:preprotein translocase subunit SecA